MLNRLHRDGRGTRGEQGFTLIELLVVILIIGILAAIAIPSFLSQKSKATDAQAKEMVRTGEEAAETYATDHGGTYTGLEAKALREYEPAILTETGSGAYLSAAEAEEEGKGYKVVATSTNGDTFTIVKTAAGTVTRTCLPVKVGTGCSTGNW